MNEETSKVIVEKEVEKKKLDNSKVADMAQVEGHERFPDAYTIYKADEIESVRVEDHSFFFKCKNGIILKIEVLTNRMFRLRYAIKGDFQRDFSYAIDEGFTKKEIKIDFEENAEQYSIRTSKIWCRISKSKMLVHFYTINGLAILEDEEGFSAKEMILGGLVDVGVSKKSPEGEQYLGLGDKAFNLNLRGQKFENWCTDAFAYGKDTDPLYRAIPFYYGLQNGESYGVFLDNTYRSHFDFDSKEKQVMRFSAAGGEMNYYFIYGPKMTDVATQYMELTGKPELPPIWALGFHQCRWSYYPESRVRELCNTFREKKIPCDAVYLDIDYMDGYRCFTWNKDYFPDPEKMIDDLSEQGFSTVVMIDPGLKVDEEYDVYMDGKEKDVYCKRPDGEIMMGPVWPLNCAFPDYTKEKVRKWWGEKYRDLYLNKNIKGFWNDMNEPAVFHVHKATFPEDIRHDYEGESCSHKKAHNIYGMQMSRATYEGLKTLKPDQRPFVITRATYSGGQRFATLWTGDNVANWKHLRIANRQCQRLSISGFSFVGTDIGGFAERPTGELMVRWLQLGVFHPLYRVHSIGNNIDGTTALNAKLNEEEKARDRMDQEPWSFGEPYTTLARQAIEFRYQLIPYMYTAFRDYTLNGKPLIRPLLFEYQTDDNLHGRDRDFMFGENLLISPVVRPARRKQKVYIPEGKWYFMNTANVFEGRQFHTIHTSLSQIPIFVKEGAVIPEYPVMQYTNERPVGKLILHVYFGKLKKESNLYEDNGNDYGYQEGHYCLTRFITEGLDTYFLLKRETEGTFPLTYNACQIFIYGLPFVVNSCLVDEHEVELSNDNSTGSNICELNILTGFSKIVFQ